MIVWGLQGLGLPGGFWCRSDLISRRNSRQCVERKICNFSWQWDWTASAFVGGGGRFLWVIGMVGDCFSLGVGPGGVWRVVFRVEL